MSRITLWLSVGVFVCGFASCFIKCPDGTICSDDSNCCKTKSGYQDELKNSHVPDPVKSSVVFCDTYTYCPSGTTCCRHPKGGWTCCRYSPGSCCLDGYHCCPYGLDCDYTYTHCVRERLTYPFLRKPALPSVPASRIPTSEDKGN